MRVKNVLLYNVNPTSSCDIEHELVFLVCVRACVYGYLSGRSLCFNDLLWYSSVGCLLCYTADFAGLSFSMEETSALLLAVAVKAWAAFLRGGIYHTKTHLQFEKIYILGLYKYILLQLSTLLMFFFFFIIRVKR